MPPRKTPEYTCDMPRCSKIAMGLGLCSYHYNRWLYLKKKVKNRSYSLKYQRLNEQLNKCTDIKLKRDIERALKQLPEFKEVQNEIKQIEYYMNPLYAYRSGKVSPKKGLRERKRKFYVPKPKKIPELCKECEERPAKTKGLCGRCYERKRRYAENIDICHVSGCNKKAYSMWLCVYHYNSWNKLRKIVKSRRYTTDLSMMVDQYENEKLSKDQRNYINERIEKRIKQYGHERTKILKIQKEFKALDSVVDFEWGYKHQKKHKKPPEWTGYKKYGPYSTRLRKT